MKSRELIGCMLAVIGALALVGERRSAAAAPRNVQGESRDSGDDDPWLSS